MPARIWEASAGRALVLLLEKGDDLLAEVERICAEYEIGVAWVSAIGAVRRASFGYYQQGPQSYVEMTSDQHTMLNGFVGNISMADGRPFLHAHATFSAVDGSNVGGHLLPGCEVFAVEVTIREMTGLELERTPDEVTGLPLW